jgi:hypothetical protein
VQMAKYLAADRLEYLYQEALYAWKNSQGHRETTRRIGTGPIAITSHSTGRDSRYLTTAGRLSLMHARLGLPFGILTDAQAELPDDTVAEPHPFVEEEAGIEFPDEQPADFAPPVGDCSENSLVGQSAKKEAGRAAAASDMSAGGCDSATHVSEEPSLPKITPVQPAAESANASPVLQMRIDPESSGVTLTRSGAESPSGSLLAGAAETSQVRAPRRSQVRSTHGLPGA